MKLTNKEALQLYQNYTNHLPKTTPKAQKASTAASKLIEHHVPNGNQKTIHLKFARLLEGKPADKAADGNVKKWEETCFLDTSVLSAPPSSPAPPDDEQPKKKGRPSLTLGDEPCLKRQRSLLKEMVTAVENFAVDQNISKEAALQMTINECERKWHTSAISNKCNIPVKDATALVYNVNLSTNQYQMMRTLCLKHGVVFPPRNDIDQHKKLYHPEITSTQLRASVDATSLLDETASSLIHLNSRDDNENGVYHLVGKFGADGSGSHKIRQQLINVEQALTETGHLDPEKTNSFLLSCYVPLELRRNDSVLWTNPVPNSTSYARPVSLTRAPEDRDVLKVELEPSFASIIREEYETVLTVGGTAVDVTCKTECSMIDGKMVSLLQGDSGAFCHLCDVTREDANNIELIKKGFHITKDYKSTKEAWDKIISGDIAYKSKERKGQCHENIVQADLHCFSVLHFKLRSLDFAEKILYRLQCGQYDWRDEGLHLPLQMLRILKKAKEECIDAIQKSTGMLIDMPTSGGNTNNGPLADRFFSAENRLKISSLILNSEDRENFEIFMSLTNVILTVTQSITDKRVVTRAVKDLGIELMVHLKTNFLDERGRSWIMIIPSFHQMCGHSWEMFEWNDGKSIAKWSECPVESWNKHVRSFQSGPAARSRQLSIKDNIHDIFRRMLIMSHPEIASKRPRPSCSICGEVGHTARSWRHRKSTVATQEQAQIESMYY